MDQAAQLGSPYIVASPPQEVVDLGRATARFAELLAIGTSDRRDPLDGVPRVRRRDQERRERLGDRLGHAATPRATVVADVFHMIRGGGSVDDLLQLPGDRLANFHINDVPAEPDPLTQTDADRVMVGEGIADLPRVIANLRPIGYRGPLSLELFNRDLWDARPGRGRRGGARPDQATGRVVIAALTLGLRAPTQYFARSSAAVLGVDCLARSAGALRA